MPSPDIHKIESPDEIYINRFWTGWYSNRSPLFTPISALGIQLIQRQDVIWTGNDMMLTPEYTCKRRYGFTKACSVAFGSGEWPLTFFSFENLSGDIAELVDTQTHVYSYTSSAKTSIFTKSSDAGQTSFNSVADTVYFVDGVDAQKWNGTDVYLFGIATPTITPSLVLTSGSLSPTVGYTYVYVFRNSSTGHISSASPYSASTGAFTNEDVEISGDGSTDPQVDYVDIYRTADGGAVFYYVASVSNASTWTYTDSTIDADLNTDLVAPLAGVNDPPPSGMSLLTWYGGRLWGVSGNTLYFSAGPDCTNGVGEEAWPAANNYTLPGNGNALISTSEGLIIFTIDTAWVVTGSTASTFTVPQMWQVNMGVASPNNVTQDGDNFFVLTTQGQVYLSESGSLTEVGYTNGFTFGDMTIADAYIAVHRSGQDEGLFISDGSSKLYRFSMMSQVWDVPYVPQGTGGIGAIASVEDSSGQWQLLMGRASGSQYILYRDVTSFQDDGNTYTPSVTFGSLVVAPPRKAAPISCVLTQLTAVGTYPTVSVMLNEIEDTGTNPATFIVIPNPVPDPPLLTGYQNTIWQKRHDFKAAQTPLPASVCHMQIKFTFSSENEASEILGWGVK